MVHIRQNSPLSLLAWSEAVAFPFRDIERSDRRGETVGDHCVSFLFLLQLFKAIVTVYMVFRVVIPVVVGMVNKWLVKVRWL